MKKNILNIEYHSNSLEISSRRVLSIHNNGIYRSDPCKGRFSIFEKKVQFFPLKGKKLTRSHFVQKLAQILRYGQTVIGIV